MKKVLFIAPDYYGFSNVVFEGLQKFGNCNIRQIDSNAKYQYKNFGERVYNFFLKNLCGKNLKNTNRDKYIARLINASDYDILFVIGAYTLTDENLNLALSKAKYSITLFWDSIEKIPMQKDYINRFDACYSFDSDDCKKYNLKEITNFYFIDECPEISNSYDVSYLATYDNRISDTILLFQYFSQNKIKAKAKILSPHNKSIQNLLPENMEEIREIIPFSEAYKYYLDSKIILDIAHSNQRGLSFRPFEAIGLQKKLITTNKDIANYDFYNPNNIFIIDDIKNFSLLKSFIETEYQELPLNIREKYHIKNWVKRILTENEH